MTAATTTQATKATPEEYLALDRKTEWKLEYLNGEAIDVPPANRHHCQVVGNVLAGTAQQLRGKPSEVYASRMRVKVQATGMYAFPDVVAVCGAPEFEEDPFPDDDTLLNPAALFEVVSPASAGHDRGVKFQHYRKLPSPREYVLIAQERPHVERWSRQEGGQWLLWETDDLDGTVTLASIGVKLSVAEIYDRVTFQQGDESGEAASEAAP